MENRYKVFKYKITIEAGEFSEEYIPLYREQLEKDERKGLLVLCDSGLFSAEADDIAAGHFLYPEALELVNLQEGQANRKRRNELTKTLLKSLYATFIKTLRSFAKMNNNNIYVKSAVKAIVFLTDEYMEIERGIKIYPEDIGRSNN